MYKEILRSIAGIEVFPLLSLGVFVAVFVLVLVWAFRLDAARLRQMSHLPLDPSPEVTDDRQQRQTPQPRSRRHP
jgi:hypothetical protein